MKIRLLSLTALIAFLLQACSNDSSHNFESVENDPLNARIYTLENGLKIYINTNKDAPRVQTYIAVRAGSKNDPADATGLAHYLEHMLFKGTDTYGTLNFEKEQVELDKIEQLYETYRKTSDEAARKQIYHQIDSISGVAAKLAIANEYDKMLTAIGAKGTNAYTWVEQTVYVNDIPSNQLKKWLKVEGERFRKPVLRIFHTELEAVYEEKNISLDNDQSKLWETLFASLFPTHTYGTQTTIGTIEHLKNPSITEIKKYFDRYYVPNNMAIILSGDFNADSAVVWAEQAFGSLVKKEVPEFKVPQEKPITTPIEKEVLGPQAEEVAVAFRLPGIASAEAEKAEIVTKLLNNNTAGLIDLNINQQQKAIEAYSYFIGMKDYSVHLLGGKSKQGQSLQQVKDLLLAEVEKLKKGDFPDWLLTAVINDMRKEEARMLDNNYGRAELLLASAVYDMPWKNVITRLSRQRNYTKKDIVEFVKANYQQNYVAVYKKTGEDKNVKKVEKPAITPVEVNRDAQSPFVKSIIEEKAPEMEPVFVDYSKELTHSTLASGVKLTGKTNESNDLFSLVFRFAGGTNHDRYASLALNYLPYLGTDKLSASEVQQELFKLAANFSVYADEDQSYITLEGITENLEKSIAVMEDLIRNSKPDEAVLQNMISDEFKKRADAKLDPETIKQGLVNYARYGAKNPFNNVLSDAELKALKSEELINRIHTIFSNDHQILFYGKTPNKEVADLLNKLHQAPNTRKTVSEDLVFSQQNTDKNLVFVANYPGMKKADIYMINKGENYNPELLPKSVLFNEYFGGGMQSIVFQELRESKALAYSTRSYYSQPMQKNMAFYNVAYIGTQADKLPEAMAGLSELLNKMPESEKLFTACRDAVLNKIRTERIIKSQVLWNYVRAQKLGLDYDDRKSNYAFAQKATLADISDFHKKYVANKSRYTLVLGDKNVLDPKTLAAYGEIKELTLKDIFGW